MNVISQNIPRELRDVPQWVCWRHESRAGKPTKPLYDPKTRFRQTGGMHRLQNAWLMPSADANEARP